jgi:hypothetical protein
MTLASRSAFQEKLRQQSSDRPDRLPAFADDCAFSVGGAYY